MTTDNGAFFCSYLYEETNPKFHQSFILVPMIYKELKIGTLKAILEQAHIREEEFQKYI